MLMLFLCMAFGVVAETLFPARCRVTTTLNVRQGPGTGYSKIGKLYKNDYIVVESIVRGNSRDWGVINYHNQTGYIAMQYTVYMKAIQPGQSEQTPLASSLLENLKSLNFSSFLSKAWNIVKYILLGLLILIILAFWRNILQIIFFVGIFMGIGALICKLLFNNANLGASIGFVLAVLIGLKKIIDFLGVEYSTYLELIYKFVSIPVFYSNRLQHILTEPWRYIFKTNWVSEGIRKLLRPTLYFLQILLYIATTPLRLFNAILYNILIYVTTEIYDLFFEVLQPSSSNEGAGSFWKWLVMFPWRLIKYPIAHGIVTLSEGVIWTIIDIFIPAITMYHGTDLTAGQAITCSNQRNEYLRENAEWTQGTFTASKSSWGGIGVYFASRRSVAKGYAFSPWRLSDENPVMIVCRVSLGKIINYALAPDYVYQEAGDGGRHAVLNKYGEKNGYDTGEWWNGGPNGYWEYCMFDWQNRYNHPWRIRPVYVFNFRTGRAQHIKGGMRHWLFDNTIMDDIKKSLLRYFRWMK